MTDEKASAAQALLSSAATLFTAGSVLVGMVFWFAHLEAGVSDVGRQVSRLESAQVQQTAHIDKIEEGRAIGLQRLSRAEEAIASLQMILARIDGKLDRALDRRSR